MTVFSNKVSQIELIYGNKYFSVTFNIALSVQRRTNFALIKNNCIKLQAEVISTYCRKNIWKQIFFQPTICWNCWWINLRFQRIVTSFRLLFIYLQRNKTKKIVTLNFIVVISKNVNIYAIWRVHDSFAAAGVCINIETFQAFNETTTVVSTILEKVIFIASFIILMLCKLHRHKHRAHSNQAENATNYSIIRQFFLQFYNF